MTSRIVTQTLPARKAGLIISRAATARVISFAPSDA